MEKKFIDPEITDIKDMLKKTGELYGDRPAYKFKTEKPGEFKVITHKETREMVDALGTALVSLLNLKGKRIGVIGENRYEWEIAFLATVCGTGVIVPLDRALPKNEIENLIYRSEIDAIFYTEPYEEILIELARSGSNKLKHLIRLDSNEHKDGIYSFKELIEKGKELMKLGDIAFTEATINNEVMTEILFTSATTSKSKAVALSHKNLCENLMDMGVVTSNYLTCEDTMLSILPVHHVFECTAGFLLMMYKGMSVGFSSGLRHIMDDIREYRVSFLLCVPALYEMMYKGILKNLKATGKYDAVMALVKQHENDSMEQKKEIFKFIHEIFGGNIKLYVSGAAALDKNVEKGYRDFGINLVQGYGLTEASPVVCVNVFKDKNDDNHIYGTIGKAMPKIQVKIDNPNEEGIGELLVKGPNVMLGYYGNEEATKETIKDGWLHTGDLCSIDENGFIYIAGRKKSVIVLKNGKNIFPEEMENLVNKIEGVKESMVYSTLNNNAIDKDDIKIEIEVVYDKEIMKEMYNTTDEEKIYQIIKEKITEINHSMPLYKTIRGITITEEPLIKTTTGKIKRYEEIKKLQ